MSLNNIVSATCPNCKKEFPFEVWNSVNVQFNPEMREKVLNGSIFNFTCPHCNFSAHTEYPILYDDMENHFMIYFCSEEDVEKNTRQLKEIISEIKGSVPEEIFASSFFRITTTYVQFMEKIKIFESKNDDRLIELMKLDLLKSAKRNNPKNQTAFILFDILPNEEFSPKVPVPSLVYYKENGEKDSAFPISIIPSEVSKIKNEYDYLGDKSFVVDYDWAARYIFTEKVGHNFFDIEFDKNKFSARGLNIAKKLLDLLGENEKGEILNSLEDDEKAKIQNATGKVDEQKILDSLKAFYRYTNFKNVLEELKDNKKFEVFNRNFPDFEFNFSKIDMQDFYTEYFKISSESLTTAVVYFIYSLIHGAKFNPNNPFDFYVRCRNKRAFWDEDEMNGEKEHDISVMRQYYKKYENCEDALAYKNCVVRYIYQYELPPDDILKIDPLKTKEMWENHKILYSKFCFSDAPMSKEETSFPLGANPKIQDLIQERYKKSCEENNLFAQVYYLNLLYNYYNKKSNEATQIDSLLNELLRMIEL